MHTPSTSLPGSPSTKSEAPLLGHSSNTQHLAPARALGDASFAQRLQKPLTEDKHVLAPSLRCIDKQRPILLVLLAYSMMHSQHQNRENGADRDVNQENEGEGDKPISRPAAAMLPNSAMRTKNCRSSSLIIPFFRRINSTLASFFEGTQYETNAHPKRWRAP